MKRYFLLLALSIFLTGCSLQSWGILGGQGSETQPPAMQSSIETQPPVAPEPPPKTVNEEFSLGTEVFAEGNVFYTHRNWNVGVDYLLDYEIQSNIPWISVGSTGYDLVLSCNGESVTIPNEPYVWNNSRDAAITYGHPPSQLVPVSALERLSGVNVLRDEEYDRIYISRGLPHGQTAENVTIPVLMYHCVSDEIFGKEDLFVSPDDFRQQMAYLKDNGYEPIFFRDLAHLEYCEKPVIVTFDDGYENNYTELYPIIQEYKIPVTIFMITDMIGTENHLTADELREMSDSGLVSIQSHTAEHLALPDATPEEQAASLERSKLELARVTGRVPYALSYPEGRFTEENQAIAEQYFDLAVRTGDGLWTTDGTFYGISRLSMLRGMTLEDFAQKLTQEAPEEPTE